MKSPLIPTILQRIRAVRSHSWWTFLFSLITLQGLSVLWGFIRLPSEGKSAIFLGFSPQRLLSILIALAVIFLWAGLACFSWKKSAWVAAFLTKNTAGPSGKIGLVLAGLVFLGLILSLLPVDWQQISGSAYLRFRPLIEWLTLAVAQMLVLWVICSRKEWQPELKAHTAGQRTLMRAALFALAGFSLLWVLIWITRVGITPDSRYWNEAGVPVLGFQILLALVISLAFGVFVSGSAGNKLSFLSGWKLDLLICCVLWLTAALLWSQTPMPRSYFAPGPYLPNSVAYPYSDAEIHDRGAQYVLIGQGLNNYEYSDKPFYMLLLAVFHLIAGQDYLKVVQLQALVLAAFPAVLYLMGKSLHSRSAGLLAGIFLVFQQSNAIAASLLIQVSHSRLEMTEFPTAFGIGLLAIVLIRWCKRPTPVGLSVLLAGGILGVLILIRTNPLFLLPFVILLFLLAFRRQWRKWLPASLLFTVGVLLVISPWFFLIRTPEGQFFIEYKIGAVFSLRYDETVVEPSGNPSRPPAETQPTLAPTATMPPTPAVKSGASPGNAVDAVSRLGSRVLSALKFTPGHFVHNLIMAALILPTSTEYNAVSFLDQDLQAAYWKTPWDGHLPFENALVFYGMLAILALGIAAAWHSARLAGLVPLILLVGYTLSNALGRTSGSRYLVPVDWVILFYFALGCIQLGMWAAVLLRSPYETALASTAPLAPAVLKRSASPSPHPLPGTSTQGWWRVPEPGRLVLGAAALGLVGSSLIWFGSLFPLRYPPLPAPALLQNALARGSLQSAGIAPADLDHFIQDPLAVVVRGKGLYPRFYDAEEGEPSSRVSAFSATGYPRLILHVVGPATTWVLLPLETAPKIFPDDRDVTVIGCKKGPDVIAKVVLVEGSPDAVYQHTPKPTWACP